MPNLALVTVEGVLRRTADDQPVPEGLGLAHALRHHYRLLYMTEMVEERASHWLTLYGVNYHSYLEPEVISLEEKLDLVRRYKAMGQPVELVIDPSPEVVASMMYYGNTALLFGHPRIARPEWRADYQSERREWASIEEEVDRQRTLEFRREAAEGD